MSLRPVIVAALGVVLAASYARAVTQPTRLLPESPKDHASVGKKPRFTIRVDGSDVEQLRFRIELSKDQFKTIDYTFDQVKDSNGWAYTALDDQSPGAVYFTRQPIAGGDYEWRVASWDGLGWQDGHGISRVVIDDVPPADVDLVRMRREPNRTCVQISWAPVATDIQGRPERVASYHVYRYAAKGHTQPIRPFEAGETAALEYEDCDAEAFKKPILFYRIVAEDEAGNIPGRRY